MTLMLPTLDPLAFVVIILATWRLAYLVTSEDAPFKLALRFRTAYPLGGLTSCLKCASIWTALLCLVLWQYAGVVGGWMVMIAAVSGAALMASSYTGVNHVA